MDITNKWIKRTKGTKGSITEKQGYTVNDVTYRVDGKHVILRPTEREREIERQIKDVYASTHTKFIKKIIVMKSGKIIRIYDK